MNARPESPTLTRAKQREQSRHLPDAISPLVSSGLYSPIHEAIAADMAHDLRSYRASQRERAKRRARFLRDPIIRAFS